MKKVLLSLLMLGILGSFSSNLWAKDLKIGYVDIFKIFNEYEKTKEYDKILEGKKTEEHSSEMK